MHWISIGLIGACIGLVIGMAWGWVWVKKKQISSYEEGLQAGKKDSEVTMSAVNEAKRSLAIEFKQLASEILEQKSQSMSEQNKQQLHTVLNPLQENIKAFEKRVEATYDREAKERFSLTREIKQLQSLNQRISEETINLTKALKGEVKTQGNWGEVILERVLEQSGLEKGREYDVQVSIKDDNGQRYQPDVIVHLPDEKDIIIDAKVSLSAYERYCSSHDNAETIEASKLALQQHVRSMQQHIDELSKKNYQHLPGLKTLDFVFMFVPIEAAFILSLQHDNDLFNNAFKKNIIIVGPTTLLATLRTVHNSWSYFKQTQNAEEIARRAGALYDKFVSFVADLDDIGSKLTASQQAYEKAYNKLSSGKGNLVRRAEQMKLLGAKASKEMPDNLVERSEIEKLE